MTKALELVDSHAHLDMEDFDPDREDVVRRAFASGLKYILCPIEISEERSRKIILDLVKRYPTVYAAAGVHPHRARLFSPGCLDKIRKLAACGKIQAVGEIGLDYHYDFSPQDDQAIALRAQIELAQELDLPVIIHSRNSGRDVIRAVRDAGFAVGGVLHCYTEDGDIAREMLDLGFFISFSGILTFPNAQALRETAKGIPLERLLVETDAPYLAPLPHRGRRNEPAYVVETARLLAGLKGLAFEDLAAAVTRNFSRLFLFEKKPLRC